MLKFVTTLFILLECPI